MKEGICTIVGFIGGFIASLFGGWDFTMTILIGSMAMGYISGQIVAGVFKKSRKSENGALESRAGWKGLCRKGMALLIVLVAAWLDMVLGSTFVRDAVVIGFIANEVISITENAGLMGVPIPSALKKAIDILKTKGENESGN